ncbi:type IX secretion system periplasmic lipoprotein PorW/SprE [Myroides phaeus]|uniref:Tetratricopeptide repeat-containing protein n=1 Tax=Myroides phaeus TaxID=702745 RepID=A0A1G8B148_9FLAO|nr:tetratricopeptide repeat protein [Myroides phaeus]SDH26876.1 Tetratricopeptide repeat-containing protein [Myroides phaeus]
MKVNFIKYLSVVVLLLVGMACSVKKDKLINRGYHAMTTRYNILYNGELAYEDALISLKEGYFDDFWNILPIERIDIKVDPDKEFKTGRSLDSKQGSLLENLQIDGKSVEVEDSGTGFERAEDKAAKAIQKHSMYIKGRERNSQMDEAYLLLGKARYYDGRFIPALEAFNYILYKYPDSDKIDQATVWREKTNVRLTYDDIAIKNLKELLRSKKDKLKKQVVADANATLAQAYINIEDYASAIAPLINAIDLTKDKEEYSRYKFILGQLYGKLGRKAEAGKVFQEVIDLNRKSPRSYVIHSHAQQFEMGTINIIDTLSFLKKYKKLLSDRENRPFLDVLNRQVGLFYDQIENSSKALEYLKEAVKSSKGDEQLKGKNYINIAEIYFNNAGYALSGQYYDSALSILPEKAKERFRITKRRDALRDVVAYEKVASTNDSILRLVAMNEDQRISYFKNYIEELRKSDFRKLQANLKGKKNQDYFNMANFGEAVSEAYDLKNTGFGGGKSSYYFYSTQATSYGKIEFKKKWGNRPLRDNWRWSSTDFSEDLASSQKEVIEEKNKNIDIHTDFVDTRYEINSYVEKIPTDAKEIALLKKDRDFAYFQLGSMYFDRFKKHQIASEKLESLLTFDPAERLILPSLYKLFKIYSEIDSNKATMIKDRIVTGYPNSRYAKLLQNLSSDKIDDLSPEQVYATVYKLYNEGDYKGTYRAIENALERYDDEGYVGKLELLKANVIGNINGLEAYKEALNYVALTYSSSLEGREANKILETIIPVLESKKFSDKPSKSWKVVLLVEDKNSPANQLMSRKLIQYANQNSSRGIKYSEDLYNSRHEFFVLHGFKTKEEAISIASMFGSDSKPINSENYGLVQIKKNWQEYLSFEK